MDAVTAQQHLRAYLDIHPDQRPTAGFELGKAVERSVQGETFYLFHWVEDGGRAARGGYSYYVFADGRVVLPLGGSARPESAEGVYARWRAEKA